MVVCTITSKRINSTIFKKFSWGIAFHEFLFLHFFYRLRTNVCDSLSSEYSISEASLIRKYPNFIPKNLFCNSTSDTWKPSSKKYIYWLIKQQTTQIFFKIQGQNDSCIHTNISFPQISTPDQTYRTKWKINSPKNILFW